LGTVYLIAHAGSKELGASQTLKVQWISELFTWADEERAGQREQKQDKTEQGVTWIYSSTGISETEHWSRTIPE